MFTRQTIYAALTRARSFADMSVQLAATVPAVILPMNVVWCIRSGVERLIMLRGVTGEYRAGKEGRNEGKRRKPVRGKEKKKREKKVERRVGKQRCVHRGGRWPHPHHVC